jgi:hypothetical protein
MGFVKAKQWDGSEKEAKKLGLTSVNGQWQTHEGLKINPFDWLVFGDSPYPMTPKEFAINYFILDS